jgi:hypothetical protein
MESKVAVNNKIMAEEITGSFCEQPGLSCRSAAAGGEEQYKCQLNNASRQLLFILIIIYIQNITNDLYNIYLLIIYE